MTRITNTLAIAALCLFATAAEAQVTASSYSNGGTAVATANGRGNTRLNATAVARNGGYAQANMSGSGTNGGFASGNSRAISNGGVAISNGRSVANGWGARSHVNSSARTNFGVARSNGTAIANGAWSNARANSRANANWGQSSYSNARAVDNRQFLGPQPGYGPAVQPNYQPQPYFGNW